MPAGTTKVQSESDLPSTPAQAARQSRPFADIRPPSTTPRSACLHDVKVCLADEFPALPAAAFRLGAAAGAFLDRRALNVAVGAEHTAIARLGLQDRTAMRAVIEPLTRIGRHHLRRDAPALGTSKVRGQLDVQGYPRAAKMRCNSFASIKLGHRIATTNSSVAPDSSNRLRRDGGLQ